MPLDPLENAKQIQREHKARLALYHFLYEAMWEGHVCPPRMLGPFDGDYDQFITNELHRILRIRKPWWKKLLGR